MFCCNNFILVTLHRRRNCPDLCPHICLEDGKGQRAAPYRHAGQRAEVTHGLLRHDPHGASTEPVLARRGHGGRRAPQHDPLFVPVHLPRDRHHRHHRLQHADLPGCGSSTGCLVLVHPGEFSNSECVHQLTV